MKILVDAHVFDEKFQGSRTYLKGIYSELFQLRPDWQFLMVAHDISGLQDQFGTPSNVTFIALTSQNKYWRLLYELPSLIRKYKADYAHFQYISPVFKACKYIVTTHDILFEEPKFKKYFPFKYRFLNGLLFKRSARRADFVVTVSEYSKNKIAEIYEMDHSKIHITPNAVNVLSESLTRSNYIKDNYGCEQYILYVSRIEPRKNHLALLKAFINLKLYERNYQLVFIGAKDLDYPDMDEYLREHSDLFKNRIHTYANISPEILQYFYVNAEFFAYPSLAEGFGIPPLEAAIYDQRVLCSSVTAMKEFSFFKYHIDPNNQGAFEEAISDLIADNNYDPVSVKEHILKTYQWRKSAEILRDIIQTDLTT
jgi:glycosyltransferase involved in cell wall biosynthesis